MRIKMMKRWEERVKRYKDVENYEFWRIFGMMEVLMTLKRIGNRYEEV